MQNWINKNFLAYPLLLAITLKKQNNNVKKKKKKKKKKKNKLIEKFWCRVMV
jgi:hypothetical protein